MYSPEFMKFLINRDIEEYTQDKAKVDSAKTINFSENKMFALTRFATVPVEIKK